VAACAGVALCTPTASLSQECDPPVPIIERARDWPAGRRLDRVEERPRQTERRTRIRREKLREGDRLFSGWRLLQPIERLAEPPRHRLVEFSVGRKRPDRHEPREWFAHRSKVAATTLWGQLIAPLPGNHPEPGETLSA